MPVGTCSKPNLGEVQLCTCCHIFFARLAQAFDTGRQGTVVLFMPFLTLIVSIITAGDSRP